MSTQAVSAGEQRKGILALLLVTLTWALFSVYARAMHSELGNIHQLTFRLIVGSLFLVLVRPSLLSLHRYKKYSAGDWALLGVRSLLFTALGSLPWVVSINSTDIATTSFVQALPFTCLWGVVIFRERRPLSAWLVLSLAVTGAAVMFGIFPGQSLQFGRGECLALISSMAFPLGLILRRKHSDAPQDLELSALVLLLGIVQTVIAAYLFGEAIPAQISPRMLLLGGSAGILVAASLFFSSYGMPRVSGVLGGLIFTLESPLCVILAFLFFNEIPSLRTLVGGCMIFSAAIAMCILEQRLGAGGPQH